VLIGMYVVTFVLGYYFFYDKISLWLKWSEKISTNKKQKRKSTVFFPVPIGLIQTSMMQEHIKITRREGIPVRCRCGAGYGAAHVTRFVRRAMPVRWCNTPVRCCLGC
jgi:hypothetical protein